MTAHVAVIGAGPAGMAAASAAADAGARVTLIGAEPPGGRAGWHSLLPSKVLLTAADSLGLAQRFQTLGLGEANKAPEVEAAVLLNETEGFVKLVADANAVGAHAADVLAPVALGIRLGARLEDLAALFAAHPCLGELVFAAARVRQSIP